jgi:signal transduction histidine kinase
MTTQLQLEDWNAHEVASQNRTEMALQRRIVELSTLNRIAHAVATVTDLPAALHTVAEILASLFDARSTIITLLETGKAKVLARFSRTSQPAARDDQEDRAHVLTESEGLRQILGRGQTVVLPNAQTSSLPAAVREQFRAQNLHSVMVVPLRIRGEVMGLMGIGSDQVERAFTPDEISLAETVAADVAGAIENARLYEQAQVVAVGAERQRMARALHDSVTQSLYSMTLFAEGWRTLAEQGRLSDPIDCFRQLEDIGQQALKEMRLLLHQLRPPILEDVGLVGALQHRLDAVEQRVGIETALQVEGEVHELAFPVAEQLFRIAQEALNNALRHANASESVVCLHTQGQRIVLSVQDNGDGFDPGEVVPGMGLKNMRERAQSIGGRISVTSQLGQGTTVAVTVDRREQGK